MSSKSPIFSIAEPQHFSDHYVFHPQIDYFQQILVETRKQKIKEVARYSIDTLHFELQKLISKDESSKKIKKHSHKKKWWKNALLFFKRNKTTHLNPKGGSIYGPVYITESRTGSLIQSKKGDLEIPYINLKKYNMDCQHGIKTTLATPIYLVT
ncbi:uncharacterized protein LOC132642210 isoform X1 [Lycium barbarum]|uniref:uncharacterized protein LOC132642210 isoform X1 n=1 Tax=Lycium barbarum TaxID=112863 RepID=UPI00293E1BC7|nr:uncharacterized protein LOC132642210 isoform X1 [Lycium barbarum]